eukprot:CAMPEP_0178796408 /NCGR_PEP_ID=MMETSP0745-20121128/10645_1 /TAXON_ID=913974 /ORGANISM="Nitzschia punctata, Strain CCMP561" /LENGTH=163 /DNA_ID=CAMNT_0020454869 /DNA_START=165 /DNA_END=656 /DNA_ORIENTATION=-
MKSVEYPPPLNHILGTTATITHALLTNGDWQRERQRKQQKEKQEGFRMMHSLASEEFGMMQPEPTIYRKNLVQSILMHQAQCRAKGYCDPSGYAYLSKALSKADKKEALKVAAANAYEVQAFQQESHAPSVTDLFGEYYLKSVHPYLWRPFILMSKLLLCELD